MRRRTRHLLAFGGVVGGGLLLWTGHAFGSHGPRTLHTCVSQAGTIRVAQSCQALESAVVLVQEKALTDIEEHLAALKAKVAALETTLAGVTRSGDTLTFSGMNVQVVNGLGSTATTNALGNLIIGYNENPFGALRTGSHNLVVGPQHTYSSFGGLVAGFRNAIMGPSASVSGGFINTASGSSSSVSGGGGNIASGPGSSVSGGGSNDASGVNSSVSGGVFNAASGPGSSVSGGESNDASGGNSSVSGGFINTSSGSSSSVSGGSRNTANGGVSVVSGGTIRTVSGDFDWRAGSLFEDD